MIFLGVLAAATSIAGAILRHDRRRILRWGFGLAMVAAGAAHLARPVPFEQHLPGWVPAAAALVAATGVIEIALGVALVVAPGRPRSHARRTIGRLAAVYLMGVLPANVYVAVASVDVDGQPGGVYPWLRLPLQVVFVVWAAWSTADPRDRTGRAWIDLPSVRLPWVSGPGRARRDVAVRGEGRVVMASRLELRRFRDVPAFLMASLELRRVFRRTPGADALSLRASLLGRTFWTLSVWESHDALRAFSADATHAAVMRRFHPVMRMSQFVDWSNAGADLPTWQQARRRITDASCAR